MGKGEQWWARVGVRRPSQGSTEPQLIYSPWRSRGGKGWTEGWRGMPTKEKKKEEDIYSSREAVVG